MRDILLVVGVPIVAVLFIFGIFYMYDSLKRRFLVKRKENQLRHLLAGRELEAVLEASPYDFGHFQGEDGYRIYDTREESLFVGFAYTRLDAHIWIVDLMNRYED